MKLKSGSSRKLRYGGVTLALTTLILAVVIIVNVIFTALAQKFLWYADLTPELLFTLSDNCVDLIANGDDTYEQSFSPIEMVDKARAEKRAADPKRLEAYGNVIERIREGSSGTVCAVDLGCGQGFWAQEMEKQGLSVLGVDNEDAAVQACREKQLNAVCADEAEWMRNCQSEAADLITVMQKAGAIGPEKMVVILTEAARVLRPGGVIIIEDGKKAIGTPMAAETLTAAAKHAGLKTETVKFGSDYAVIASKEDGVIQDCVPIS